MPNDPSNTFVSGSQRSLLSTKMICSKYGLSQANAYRIMHVHGIKIGGQFYITDAKLWSVLNTEKTIEPTSKAPWGLTNPTRTYHRR